VSRAKLPTKAKICCQSGKTHGVTADYFDQWYADIDRSAIRQRLSTAGLDLPDEVSPSSMVPMDGLREVASSLALSPDDVVVDLGCGRGGPGMWVARELGVQLIGIDFSAEAVRQATARRVLFGLQTAATFAVGRLEDTGLASDSADAAICIDSFQFASTPADAASEVRRILRSGARFTLTTWESVGPNHAQVPDRVSSLDVGAALAAAGFLSVRIEPRPAWHELARQRWEAVLATSADDDPALQSMQAEGTRSLATHHKMRRILATAVSP
jgi:SAM-dependent methyltransferase